MDTAELAKLTIRYESKRNVFDQKITVQFNPNTLTISQSANWGGEADGSAGSAPADFTRPVTLGMDLFFDTYQDRTNVRKLTNQVFRLMTLEASPELHRPPLCQMEWGEFRFEDGLLGNWILQEVNQKLTLFLPDGTPVRATLDCSFKQYRDAGTTESLTKLHSADVVKTRTLRRGDTLSHIAAQEYDDPRLWRHIARGNGIVDPRRIEPGRVIAIPTLDAARLSQER